MAEILIKGMTLPKEGETLILAIDSEGNIDQQAEYLNCFYHLENVAIEVPSHGDLKDTNKILQWLNRICDEGQSVSVGEIIDYIDNAPTVLEATEGRKK